MGIHTWDNFRIRKKPNKDTSVAKPVYHLWGFRFFNHQLCKNMISANAKCKQHSLFYKKWHSSGDYVILERTVPEKRVNFLHSAIELLFSGTNYKVSISSRVNYNPHYYVILSFCRTTSVCLHLGLAEIIILCVVHLKMLMSSPSFNIICDWINYNTS